MQALDGALGRGDASLARVHDQQGAIGGIGQNRGIGNAHHGRTIDDYLVVVFRGNGQQRDQLGARQQLCRVRRQRSGKDDLERGLLGVLHGLGNVVRAGQQVAEANFRTYAQAFMQ